MFRDRILPFDLGAARHYAALAIIAKNSGQGFPTPDGYIAAARQFMVASRDVSSYQAMGVAIINPWEG